MPVHSFTVPFPRLCHGFVVFAAFWRTEYSASAYRTLAKMTYPNARQASINLPTRSGDAIVYSLLDAVIAAVCVVHLSVHLPVKFGVDLVQFIKQSINLGVELAAGWVVSCYQYLNPVNLVGQLFISLL
jgi:hypothetical protein